MCVFAFYSKFHLCLAFIVYDILACIEYGPLTVHLFVAGVYIDTLSLCNAPPIRTCPVGTDNETRKRCEEGSNAFMSFNEKVYKNIDCLACNEGNSVVSSWCLLIILASGFLTNCGLFYMCLFSYRNPQRRASLVRQRIVTTQTALDLKVSCSHLVFLFSLILQERCSHVNVSISPTIIHDITCY